MAAFRIEKTRDCSALSEDWNHTARSQAKICTKGTDSSGKDLAGLKRAQDTVCKRSLHSKKAKIPNVEHDWYLMRL